jgi:mono/diheme cytochrome c family protein/uncharacterized membrane protein
MNRRTLSTVLILGTALTLTVPSRAEDASPGGTNLAVQVKAVFTLRCAPCHGPEVPKPRAGFGYVLDLKRVASNPKMVIPSNPDESELWAMVRGGEMPPPDATPLTEAQKEVIHSWILAGAPTEDSPSIPPDIQTVSVEASTTESGSVPGNRQTLRQIGKFHLLVLHFPIALLLAACLAEVWVVGRRSWAPSSIVRFCVALGAASAVTAVVLGWIWALSGKGAGSPDLLALHRWLGTGAGAWAMVTALGTEWDAWRGTRSWPVRVLVLLGGVIVAVAAHFGGVLVHGPDF